MDNESKENEGKESAEAAANNDSGHLSETAKEIENLNRETERLNKALAEKQNAEARAKLGGVTVGAPQKEEPHEETPAEYSKRIAEEVRTGKRR